MNQGIKASRSKADFGEIYHNRTLSTEAMAQWVSSKGKHFVVGNPVFIVGTNRRHEREGTMEHTRDHQGNAFAKQTNDYPDTDYLFD